MSRKTIVKPAEAGERCALCGRTHRKVWMTNAGWMGRNCMEDYHEITSRIRSSNSAESYVRALWGNKKVDKALELFGLSTMSN